MEGGIDNVVLLPSFVWVDNNASSEFDQFR